MTKKSAAYVIAFHFGCDVADIRDCKYQTYTPSVFCINDDYFCALRPNEKKPDEKRFTWTEVASHYGRTIFKCAMENQNN